MLLFSSCSAKERYIKSESVLKKLPKENLDFYYLAGLDCEYNRDFLCSKEMFTRLYTLTKQDVFLKKAVRFAIIEGDYKLFEKNLKAIEKLAKKDSEIASYLVPYYVRVGERKRAENITKTLYKNDKSEKNLELLVAMYIDSKEYKKAEELLNRYIDKNGCDTKLCGELLLIKTKQKDVDGSIKVLQKLYESTKNRTFQNEIIKLYLLKGDMKELESYFAFSDAPKEILIDIYASKKMYKKAEKLAFSEYQKTKNPLLLANSAIYLYEGSYKENHKVLKEVIRRFKKSVDTLNDPTFYNYLGYLLIDHDIDIKEGLKYVKKALKLEPKNEYYLDSLAWGYFKEGRCKEAYEILKKLKDKEQVEIKEHLKKAKECLKR